MVAPLDLRRNKFAIVDNLRKCVKLKHLDLGFNQLRTISSFSQRVTLNESAADSVVQNWVFTGGGGPREGLEERAGIVGIAEMAEGPTRGGGAKRELGVLRNSLDFVLDVSATAKGNHKLTDVVLPSSASAGSATIVLSDRCQTTSRSAPAASAAHGAPPALHR